MSSPRPKILTAFTVPTGGWDFKFYISAVSQYDTAVTVNVPAGDYFVSNDHQDDDFLHVLATAMSAAIYTTGAPFDSQIGEVTIYLNSSHKVVISFCGDDFTGATQQDVKLAWTEEDGDDIADVLGFNNSADDTSTTTNFPSFTADWHHAYGWYADDDGLLEGLLVEDEDESLSLQSISHSGKVITQLVAERYKNTLSLQWLTRAKTFTAGVRYGDASVYPFERNEGLEAWWLEAKRGVRFRVYRDGNLDRTHAVKTPISSGTTTTATVTGITLDTDPQRWKGRILEAYPFGVNDVSFAQRFYIESHTATVITVANADSIPYSFFENAEHVYLYDQPYQTYVLDTGRMRSWLPAEIPQNDYYNVMIPLRRYVA